MGSSSSKKSTTWGDIDKRSYVNSHLIVKYENYVCKILVDTGAGMSYISEERLTYLKKNSNSVEECLVYSKPLLEGNTTKYGECLIKFQLDSLLFKERFYIVKTPTNILGQTFIKKFIKNIDYVKKCIVLKNGININILHNQLLSKDLLYIRIGAKYYIGIIDTGACVNVISKKHLQDIKNNIKKIKKLDDKYLQNVNNKHKCEFIVSLSFQINGTVSFIYDFYIADYDKPYIIIGMDFIKKYIANNDIGNSCLTTHSGKKIFYVHC